MRVIGMMSGTSFDAVDAAVADLELQDGTVHLTPRGLVSAPYPEDLVRALRAALPPAATTMATVCRLDTEIGQAFAELAARADSELAGGRAELVVSHGQTVFHWSEDGRVHGTLQLGQPAWIAEQTGLPVLADLRSRDVAAGGQGAPLVSALDVLWLRGRGRTSVALNLGGIANITVVGADAEPVAFDTGPAGALVDAVVQRASDGAERYDTDGALAASGRVDADLLAELLSEPYYARPAPKSTGKELFSLTALDAVLAPRPPVALADLVATLTALTAETVAAAVRAAGGAEVVAAGGGTQNPTLMAWLRERLDGLPLLVSDELGLPAAAKEAYAFALLGFLSVHGLPASVPACTGARRAAVLGSLTPGRDGWPRLARPAETVDRLVVHHERISA